MPKKFKLHLFKNIPITVKSCKPQFTIYNVTALLNSTSPDTQSFKNRFKLQAIGKKKFVSKKIILITK
jgi:hypothetical protein